MLLDGVRQKNGLTGESPGAAGNDNCGLPQAVTLGIRDTPGENRAKIAGKKLPICRGDGKYYLSGLGKICLLFIRGQINSLINKEKFFISTGI
jgi:hypothetical protein